MWLGRIVGKLLMQIRKGYIMFSPPSFGCQLYVVFGENFCALYGSGVASVDALEQVER